MSEDETGYMLEDNVIILTKQTLDTFLRNEHSADLIALYTFYCYTARWQRTNTTHATTGFTAQALNWSEPRVRRTKQELLKYGLIEDITKFKDGKISGHYVKVNYMLKRETVQSIIGAERSVYGGNVPVVDELPSEQKNTAKTDYDGIVKDFNETCRDLPRVTVLSESRKRAIRARMKDMSLEQIHEVFVKANASNFLTGKSGGSGGRSFKATFDWLMKDSNAAKVLDGNYDNRGDEKPENRFYSDDDILPF